MFFVFLHHIVSVCMCVCMYRLNQESEGEKERLVIFKSYVQIVGMYYQWCLSFI